jgi:O-antigen ligase
VLRAAAALVAVAAGTALLQAYGVRTEYFSVNRAPGGTFGNRNFVAHLCAIGLPVLAYLALRARSARGLGAALGVLAAAAATLVLTRSRAAWLASAAAAVPFALGVARAARARRAGGAITSRTTRRRPGPPPSAFRTPSTGAATRPTSTPPGAWSTIATAAGRDA